MGALELAGEQIGTSRSRNIRISTGSQMVPKAVLRLWRLRHNTTGKNDNHATSTSRYIAFFRARHSPASQAAIRSTFGGLP
jgi:hypothetical protein